MEFQPHVTVATVVEVDQRFLLVEEWSGGQLVLNQPAGHVEVSETLQAAAVRETLEETGWQIALKGVLGVSLYTAPANGVTYLRTSFVGEALRQCSHQLDSGIVGTAWLSYEEMKDSARRMRSPLVLATVEQYRRGQIYPLDLIFGS